MKICVNIANEKIKELSETFLILSNVRRLKLILLLERLGKCSSVNIHKEAKKSGIYDNRETTYRALEDLVKTKLVNKEYDEEKKELVYSLKNENPS